MDSDEIIALTERVICCAFRASTTLGAGFLEKVYKNALAIERRRSVTPIALRWEGRRRVFR